MATFGFKKAADDIEEPVLLPEDWYEAEIKDEPQVVPNNTLKELAGEGASEEIIDKVLRENPKAGYNLKVNLNIVSDDEMFNGRFFSVYLPFPNDYDEDRYDGIGQKVYDAKLQRIIQFAEAFGGDVDGENVTILPGLDGKVYIVQQMAPGRDSLSNSVDLFSGFKPVEED